MKEVNKVPRLSGPGLETVDVPGVTALGGKWPGRHVSDSVVIFNNIHN